LRSKPTFGIDDTGEKKNATLAAPPKWAQAAAWQQPTPELPWPSCTDTTSGSPD